MSKSFDLRRARPWEVALTVFALSAPLLVPLTAGGGSFVRTAIAQEMATICPKPTISIAPRRGLKKT